MLHHTCHTPSYQPIEPTVVPPVLLGLCSVFLLHRFSSPAWWEHLAKHVAAEIDSKEAFDKVVNLEVNSANVSQAFSGSDIILTCVVRRDRPFYWRRPASVVHGHHPLKSRIATSTRPSGYSLANACSLRRGSVSPRMEVLPF